MIQYDGGPITPDTIALKVWKGGHAFVSFAHSGQMKLAAEVSSSFAIDNGAFSLWKAGKATDWNGFYAFVETWRRHPRFDFAVVPDVIEGTEDENDALANEWPFPKHEAAVVWHSDESVERLVRLANSWPRVCIGSSGKYDVNKPKAFVEYMKRVLPAICDKNGYPVCKLHGLRMLNPAIFTELPLSSADSTNIARNVKIDKAWKGTYQPRSREARAMVIRDRLAFYNSKCRLEVDDVFGDLL